MSWTNPPKAEPVATKSEPEEKEYHIWLHPLDYDRVSEYIDRIMGMIIAESEDYMKSRAAGDEVLLGRMRGVFHRNAQDLKDDLRVDAMVPHNYMRKGVVGEAAFKEQKITTFFEGIEDKAKIPNDIGHFKVMLIRSGNYTGKVS